MKINWLQLQSTQDVDNVITRSFQLPCLIFKHSTRCEISSIAKYRLETDWAFDEDTLEAYFLDILDFRPVSHHIAQAFSIHHESPQALLIFKGECIFDVSHLDISVAELKEALALEATH
jgi:bacillithiol system protein YtxJ